MVWGLLFMKNFAMTFAVALLAASMLGLLGCCSVSADAGRNPIVGTWLVKDSGAPFPYHMYVFNADGTMQQANPDAGDPRTSDSDGKGVWMRNGDRIRCKWMEIVADRTNHQFGGRTEIACEIQVNMDTFTGTETVSVFDVNGSLTEGPTSPTPLEGKRVTLR
jgi:hypothetical protein